MAPWTIHRFKSVTSTMETAKALLKDHKKGRYAVLAEQQNQGRGRQQRPWFSPKGNLYTTFVTPVSCFESAPLYSYIAALSAHDTLSATVQDAPSVTLKWPNDLLLKSEKTGGVLLELEQTPQGLMLFIGVGINLKMHPENTPYPATNLSAHGVQITPEEMLAQLLGAFDQREALFQEKGFEPLRQAWLLKRDPAHVYLTLKASEHDSKVPLTGSFHDLDNKGLLVLEVSDATGQKTLKKFSTGDVFFS